MIDELQMKRIEKRLDEIDTLVAQYLTNREHIPEELRKEHRELSDKFNGMVSEMHKAKTEELMKIIQKEEL